MALIICPECGRSVSEKAEICPNCGCPISKEKYQTKEEDSKDSEDRKEKKKQAPLSTASAVLAFFTVTAILGFALGVVDLCKNRNDGRKHTGSVFAVIWGLLIILMFGCANSGSSSKKADSATTGSTTISAETNTADTGSTSTNSSSTTAKTNADANVSETETVEETIEYATVTVDDMMDDLDSNALGASDTYKDQYLEITGRLAVIDSSGKYIGLYPINDEWAFTGVTCYIKTDEQREAVKAMVADDTVTLRGKCTAVGEVLGYSLDIDEIVD